MVAISKHMIMKEFDVNASHVDQRRVDVSLKSESPLMGALKARSKSHRCVVKALPPHGNHALTEQT